MTADDAEHVVQIQSALSHDQKDRFKIEVSRAVIAQFPNLYQGSDRGKRRQHVNEKLGHVRLEYRDAPVAGFVDQHEEQDETDDRENQN